MSGGYAPPALLMIIVMTTWHARSYKAPCRGGCQLDLLVIDVPFLPGLIFRSLNPVQDVEQALLADVDLERTEDTECWAA
ncbi:hypothetical protein VTI28DRAFT_1256 [Corynascus sepedonium]